MPEGIVYTQSVWEYPRKPKIKGHKKNKVDSQKKLKIQSSYLIVLLKKLNLHEQQIKRKSSVTLSIDNLPDTFWPYCTFTAEISTDKMYLKCLMFPVLTDSRTSLHKQLHTKFNSLGSIVSHNFLKTDLMIFNMVSDSEIEADSKKKQWNQIQY